jgi:O-acetyl-ADP-ribose deacetylase (regulator of RNase III)
MKIGKTEIHIIQGDILSLDVDAIVNPSNKYLQHGGGLAGQIVRRGGYSIQRESDKLAPIDVGSSVITGGGNLLAKYIIHTVGPAMGEGEEDDKFKSAIKSVLKLATEKQFERIAIPAISTGVFRYPVQRCAENMLGIIMQFCKNNETSIKEIIICLYDNSKFKIFSSNYKKIEKIFNALTG